MRPWMMQPKQRWPAPFHGDAETTLDRLVSDEPEEDPDRAELGATFGLLVRVARALLGFGLPAHRVESALGRLAEALGYRVDALCTPTGMMVTLSDGHRRQTRVVRTEPGGNDLERLGALHRLVDRVERHELAPAEASARLDKILGRPERYGHLAVVASTAAASGASAALLGGGPGDLLPALALGALVGVMLRLAGRSATFARVLPAVAALLTSLLARLFAATSDGVHESILVIAAVIVLLPGFTLTVATMELASAHVVSGTARLVGAFATLVQLGFGVALGHRIATWLPAPPAAGPAPDIGWLVPAAYVVAGLAFCVKLKAAPRDIPWVVLATLFAAGGASLGNLWLGPELGALLGATVIGLLAHAYARKAHRPALLMLTPGILILVPGSLGFLSVESMLESDVLAAAETAFRMILIATSLAAGVLVASVAIPPKRSL